LSGGKKEFIFCISRQAVEQTVAPLAALFFIGKRRFWFCERERFSRSKFLSQVGRETVAAGIKTTLSVKAPQPVDSESGPFKSRMSKTHPHFGR
jgi:hypothetical protein